MNVTSKTNHVSDSLVDSNCLVWGATADKTNASFDGFMNQWSLVPYYLIDYFRMLFCLSFNTKESNSGAY